MAETRSTVALPVWFVEPTFAGRFLAAVTDGLVLFLAGFGLTILLGPGSLPRYAMPAVTALYTIGAIALTGRTVGKRLFGLRVADLDTGAMPNLGAAVRRWLVPAAPGLVAYLSGGLLATPMALAPLLIFWGVLVGPLHRGLHDRAAGTIVTFVGPARVEG